MQISSKTSKYALIYSQVLWQVTMQDIRLICVLEFVIIML